MSHTARTRTLFPRIVMTIIAGSASAASGGANAASAGTYDDLVTLFAEWRAFEQPPLVDGAPDYSAAAFSRRREQWRAFRDRLLALRPDRWPVEQQADYHLVRAELNGFDFYTRVLKPWERDPAFYTSIWTAQSDTPAHEGPTNHAAIELWTCSFPLTSAAEAKLTQELGTIPPLLAQARRNLTGNARDLWVAGIRTVRQQDPDLAALDQKTPGAGRELKQAIAEARRATVEFVRWLEQQAPSKTGPSGIGKENYNWSLRNVHLVPLSWDDEVMLLKRELARAHAQLRLEEHRNRNLPPMPVIANREEYDRRANEAVTRYMASLVSDTFHSRISWLSLLPVFGSAAASENS